MSVYSVANGVFECCDIQRSEGRGHKQERGDGELHLVGDDLLVRGIGDRV
jgi:hypothetical protein